MDPKSGWKTSEFWLVVCSKLLALLVAGGSISTGDASTLNGALVIVVPAAVALAGSAAADWKYIHARLEAKKAAADDLQQMPPDRPVY